MNSFLPRSGFVPVPFLLGSKYRSSVWIRIRNKFFLFLDPFQNDTDPQHCCLGTVPVVSETVGLVVLLGGALLVLPLQVLLDPPLGEHLPALVTLIGAHIAAGEDTIGPI